MPRDVDEIEFSFRSGFPIMFGKSTELENEVYIEKKNSVTDFALSVSGPFISADAIRYQSILLYSSLILISITFLSVKDIKVGDVSVQVDNKLLFGYSAFLLLIGTIFLIKCYVDHQRAQFVRERNVHSVMSLQNLNSLNSAKAVIEQYFWLETFDLIASTYDIYKFNADQALGRSVIEHVPIKLNSIKLNLEEIKEDQDLYNSFKIYSKFFKAIERRIEHDKNTFCIKSSNLISNFQIIKNFDDQRHSKWDQIQNLYKIYLSPWVEVRNKLVNENWKVGVDNRAASLGLRRLEAMLGTLKRIVRIRRFYIFVEIVGPIIFAAGALSYVLINKNPSLAEFLNQQASFLVSLSIKLFGQ